MKVVDVECSGRAARDASCAPGVRERENVGGRDSREKQRERGGLLKYFEHSLLLYNFPGQLAHYLNDRFEEQQFRALYHYCRWGLFRLCQVL